MRKVSKMILVLFAVVAMLVCLKSSAYASEIVTITDSDSGLNATANSVNNIGTLNQANTTNEANEQPIVIENEVPEEDIPDTGREDTVLLVLIAVVAISSIYTYLKVRKYNI